ncbi:SLC35A4 upstream open reading frame protein isoform X2 [Octodon degus]|uniref:SLC35A4 upstream open reading frame protein isoform X2 n=1 Tax=Octodon degus TaxID=10160 RepID=A0A6P6DGM2_OCTDE|nr:SLC35A4 upstream open reading frame protein isoform X2 [Octodon degus]
MADDKDSLPKLKDLAFLKNQLERLQQRVEDEVNTGVGQRLYSGLSAYTLDFFLAWLHETDPVTLVLSPLPFPAQTVGCATDSDL